MASIRVLLADDHDIVREGTRRLLERFEGIEVVGEAADGEQAVRLAQELCPDVVVMDVRMPVLNGVEATRRLRQSGSPARVLVLSAYEDDEYVFPLLEAGASGYLLKTSTGAELAQAIHDVYQGGKVLDPRVTGKVLGQLASRQHGYRGRGMVESLSEREMEVLQSLARGLSNKEMARALSISAYTVQVHLRNIFAKMGVSSRTEAIAYALREGWLRPSPEV